MVFCIWRIPSFYAFLVGIKANFIGISLFFVHSGTYWHLVTKKFKNLSWTWRIYTWGQMYPSPRPSQDHGPDLFPGCLAIGDDASSYFQISSSLFAALTKTRWRHAGWITRWEGEPCWPRRPLSRAKTDLHYILSMTQLGRHVLQTVPLFRFCWFRHCKLNQRSILVGQEVNFYY